MADDKNIEDELKTVKSITDLSQKLAKQLEADFDAATSSVEDFVKTLQKSKREFSDIEKSSAGILDFTKKVESRTDAIEGLQKLINSGAIKQRNIDAEIGDNAKLVSMAQKRGTDEYKRRVSLGKELKALDEQQLYYREKINNLYERGKRGEISSVDHAKSLIGFSTHLSKIEDERVEATKQKNSLDGTSHNQLLAQQKVLNDSLLVHKKMLSVENSRQSKLMVINSLYSKTIAKNEDFIKLATLGANLMKGGATAYVAILDVAIDRWIELDKAAEEFRKLTGLVTTQMLHIDKAVREINTEFSYMGVTLEKAYLSAQALYGAFQTSHLVTKDMISFTSRIAENLGIIPTDVAKFSSMFSEIVKSTGATTKNIVLSAAALSSAAGVAPREVMSDIANASETTLSFLGKNPMALMRAAVEARRLGTSLENISKSGRSMLNYQESMTAELDASALLNQNISFQRSRQLAWEGKLQASRNEALRQISKVGDFTRLNVYQQESLARAAGMTVDEVIKQQNQQKALNAMKNSSDPADILRVKRYEELLELTKQNGASTSEAMLNEQRAMMDKMSMQAEMTKLTNSLYAAWVNISDALLPIANAIMPPILFTVRAIGIGFKFIGSIIRGILSPLDSIAKKMRLGEEGSGKMEKVLENMSKLATELAPKFEFIGKVIGYAVIPMLSLLKLSSAVINYFTKFSGITGLIAGRILEISNFIGNIGKKLVDVISIFKPLGIAVKFLSTISRFLGPIGLVVSAIMSVIDLFGQWMDIWANDDMDIGTKILKSLVAIPKAIWNGFVQPIVDGIDWAMKKLGVDFNLSDFFSEWGNSILTFFMELPQLVVGKISGLWDIVTGIFSGEEIGKSIVNGLSSVNNLIAKFLSDPFKAAIKTISYWLGNSPSKLGLSIVDGIKSVGSMLVNVITWPFRTAWGLVSKIFSGDAFGFITKTFSEFGPKIVEAIKSASDQIYNFITSPFKRAWEFIKSMPLINKLFSSTKDITANISDQYKTKVEAAMSSVIEIKNLDSLKEVVAQLTAAVIKLGGTAGSAATIVNTPATDNSAMIAKLDELIGLLKSGGIAVNLDGRKVSSGIANVHGR